MSEYKKLVYDEIIAEYIKNRPSHLSKNLSVKEKVIQKIKMVISALNEICIYDKDELEGKYVFLNTYAKNILGKTFNQGKKVESGPWIKYKGLSKEHAIFLSSIWKMYTYLSGYGSEKEISYENYEKNRIKLINFANEKENSL